MKKIAVIEDDVIVRETIIERLTEAGYFVVSAENGMDGIELIREQLPDLVLCDVMMPNLGGFGVLEYVRKDPATELVPFVFLSALSDKSDLRKGMLSGADDYLTKPFSREELLNAVEVRLQKRQSHEQRMHEALEQFRDSLSRSLPHEFLTPLNSILGISHLLKDHLDDFEREEVTEMLGNIHQSGQRLLRLVQNYLRFAELESLRGDDLRRAEVLAEEMAFPDQLLQETVDAVALRTGRRRDVSVRAEPARLRIGARDFEKVIEELADNACKFSLDGSRIDVQGSVAESYYEITMIDRGRGMSEQQVAAVGAYTQFDRRSYEQAGVGLGLAIVHTICEMHSGLLRIESDPGKYTAVTVLLPLVSEE
ncbi:MAG: hybrid sensor histidine kinase/response regulator [Bacteroidetes bacterium]|nr:hybrid sensor histidine kinase/response regulator [Bacteroidota bacterium]